MNRSTKILSTIAVAGVFTIATALPALADDTTEVVWLLPETVTVLPTGNTPAIWPQTYLPDGVVPCGRFGQADVYPTGDVAALIEDGILDEGEDYEVAISWRFIDGGVCEVVPPVVPPVVVPPVVPPVVVEPELAYTGVSDMLPLGLLGGGLLLLGTGVVVARKRWTA